MGKGADDKIKELALIRMTESWMKIDCHNNKERRGGGRGGTSVK